MERLSDDDIFSRLFELFNQPGPVNWKLAAEVSHHLTGERVPVDPWAAEEYRELTRLAEYRLEQVSPIPVAPAPDVLPVDAREWADRHLEAYGYRGEAFTDMGELSAAGPTRPGDDRHAGGVAGRRLGDVGPGVLRWRTSAGWNRRCA